MPQKFASSPFTGAPPKASLTEVEISQVRDEIKGRVKLLANASNKVGGRLDDYLSHYEFYKLLNECGGQHTLEQVALKLPGSQNRVSLVAHCWNASASSKGMVCILHGLFDHAGLYQHLIKYLLKNKYRVVLLELPGHGLSSGPRAVIHDFNDYAYCCYQSYLYAQKYGEGLPLYGVGQSTGGGVLLNMQYPLLGGQTVHAYDYMQFEKIVVMAPLIYPKGWGAIRVGLFLLGRFVKATPRKFSLNSHDAKFYHFIRKHDPLQPKSIPVAWTKAMRVWARNVGDFAKVLARGPSGNKASLSLQQKSDKLLVIQGDDDGTVDAKKNIPLLKMLFPKAHFLIVEDAKHHLVNESKLYRGEVYTALTRFLDT